MSTAADGMSVTASLPQEEVVLAGADCCRMSSSRVLLAFPSSMTAVLCKAMQAACPIE